MIAIAASFLSVAPAGGRSDALWTRTGPRRPVDPGLARQTERAQVWRFVRSCTLRS